jgi:hypothetical protein
MGTGQLDSFWIRTSKNKGHTNVCPVRNRRKLELDIAALDGHNRPNAKPSVGLTVATETPIVLTSAEMLNGYLGGRVFQHFGENLGAGDQRLPYLEAVIGFDEQNLVEFVRAADFLIAEINYHHVTFGNSVLLRSTFENRVHRSLRLANSCTFQTANIADLRACDQSG